MFITYDTKIRFARMVARRQVIVVQCRRTARSASYDFKFIGADEFGRYDCTPAIIDILGLPENADIRHLTVRAKDAADVVARALTCLADDGIVKVEKRGHDLYEEVRNLLTTFYM